MSGNTTDGRFTSETASEAGKRSAAVRPRKLTPERVDGGGRVPWRRPMMRSGGLMCLGRWLASGRLSGAQGGAAIRGVEVWMGVHESKLTQRVVEELTTDVKRLKKELRAA